MGGFSVRTLVRDVGRVFAAGAAFVGCLAVTTASAEAVAETAQGTGTIEDWPHCPVGSTTSFAFDATGGEPASGTFSFTCGATGPGWPETSYGGTVSCLVVAGTAATFGGTIAESTNAAFQVGEELSLSVLDGGPDGVGDGIGVLYAGAACRQEASQYPIQSGDIAVGGGVVLPTLAVNDVRRLESAAAGRITFTVTLSEPSATPVTVSITTVDGTASALSDYRSRSGTLTIMPGRLSARVHVPLVDDAVAEPDESFTVELSDAVGATIADGTGVGTIRNDDGAP